MIMSHGIQVNATPDQIPRNWARQETQLCRPGSTGAFHWWAMLLYDIIASFPVPYAESSQELQSGDGLYATSVGELLIQAPPNSRTFLG